MNGLNFSKSRVSCLSKFVPHLVGQPGQGDLPHKMTETKIYEIAASIKFSSPIEGCKLPKIVVLKAF